MGIADNLIGQTFGRLTVIEKTDLRKNRKILWKCRCSCGNICLEMGYLLKNGQVKSCGCFARDSLRSQGIKNGIEKGHIISTTINSNNTSGVKGVFWNSQKQKWHAKIKYNYKDYTLCLSDDKDECILARMGAERAVKNGDFLKYYGKGDTE